MYDKPHPDPSIPEVIEARPWRDELGSPPRVWCYNGSHPPMLWVWARGKWRAGTVQARFDWPDGHVEYQVSLILSDILSASSRTYAWPQPGLRVYQLPAVPRHSCTPDGREPELVPGWKTQT